MRRFLLGLMGLVALLWAGTVSAQAPQVNVTAEETEVPVGQPILVRVEVLVPTFMPRAPIFPTFEMPGLLVRLPERSTQPISERVDGVTWSGVRRTYRIYPMAAGVTDVPPQRIDIVYKDVETNDDVPLSVEVPAMQFTALVPPGARTLDPLILAQGVAVEQDWAGAEGILEVGDAVTRKLSVAISGASALFVPDLLRSAAPETGQRSGEDAAEVATFAPYPEDAVVTESIDRGVMSGTRSEQVSYIAQSGGEARFPDILLSWYNIDSGEVEDILLRGQIVNVATPPKTRQPLDQEAVARALATFALVCLLGWAAYRWIWPPLKTRVQAHRIRYENSVHAAHREAEARARMRDLNGVLNALAERECRGLEPGHALQASLQSLSRARYRDGTIDAARMGALWSVVERTLRRERPSLVLRRGLETAALPALNPFASPDD